jgi:hypothetical protein
MKPELSCYQNWAKTQQKESYTTISFMNIDTKNFNEILAN